MWSMAMENEVLSDSGKEDFEGTQNISLDHPDADERAKAASDVVGREISEHELQIADRRSPNTSSDLAI
jgi:hypothetical protein